MTSNMKNIIKTLYNVDEIKDKPAKERWIDSKAGWQNYHNKDKSILSIIREIEQIELEQKKYWSIKEPTENYDIDENAKNTLGTENEAPCREDYTERYIALNNEIYNQWCVGNYPKESVDLIYKNSTGYTLVELKVSGKDDGGKYTPPYALIEIIKNYYLAKDFNPNIKVTELGILSTKNFYRKRINDKNSIDAFLNDIKVLNDNKDITGLPPINIYYIDIEEDKLIDCIRDDRPVPEEIKICQWKLIENMEDWEKTAC